MNSTLIPLRDYPFESRMMICAHRGDTSRGAHENSLTAFKDAIDSGADMIETDVQMTADGRFVCHHDEFLPNGGCIWKLSLAEIRNTYTAEQLPLLEDILQLSFGKVYLNLEIKEYSSRDPKRVTEALTELVRSYGMHEYVLYSSFRIDYIRVLPWDALSIIIHPKDEYIAFFNSRSQHPVHLQKPSDEMLPSEMLKISNAIGYACMLDELTDERIQDITARNIHLSLYTITNLDEYQKAKSVKAKAIVTDIPRILAETRSHTNGVS